MTRRALLVALLALCGCGAIHGVKSRLPPRRPVPGPDAGAVGGLTLGADPLATATSVASFLAGRPLHAFIVRKEPKGHGTGQWIEGRKTIPDGSRVIVLEDVVTTGGSALRAIERCRAERLEVVACLALVDRLEGGREAIEATGVPLRPLFTRKDFLP